jgi:hypothetical protein
MIESMAATESAPTTAPSPVRSSVRAPRLASRWLLLAVLGGSALASVPRSVHASIMLALDLPELVRQAEQIAVVEVGQVQAAWDERHERIYSTIDLKIVESWKSANGTPLPPATHVTVVQPGGTVGDITMTVTGLGTFVPGERSLVFLRGPSAHAQVVGMTQGKRPIRYEPTSRRWLVAPPDLHQAKLVRPPASSQSSQSNQSNQSKSGPGTPVLQSVPRPATPSTGATVPATTTATTPATTATASAPGSRDLPLDDLRAEVKKLIGAAGPR